MNFTTVEVQLTLKCLRKNTYTERDRENNKANVVKLTTGESG